MNSIRNNAKDFLTGVIYVIVGVVAALLSRDYGMGSAVKMGPGYFPTILSGLLVVIGAVSIVRSFLKSGAPLGSIAWKGLFLVTAATVLFGLVVRGAGLVIALPILVLVASVASARFRWHHVLAMAAGVTVFCILVFQIGLGVPLPIVGSWFVD